MSDRSGKSVTGVDGGRDSGEGEGDDEGAGDVCHFGSPLILELVRSKIFLDSPDDVNLVCVMDYVHLVFIRIYLINMFQTEVRFAHGDLQGPEEVLRLRFACLWDCERFMLQ